MLGLIFGVLLTVGVTVGLVKAAAAVLGALFSGIAALVSGTASGEGLVLGIILGLAAVLVLRNRNDRRTAKGNARRAEEAKKEAAETPQPEVYYPNHSGHAGC